ncbi:3/4-fucosidase) (AtFUC1) (Alpha-L-fucoside fucohydrolase) [Durusdinium trenchii]
MARVTAHAAPAIWTALVLHIWTALAWQEAAKDLPVPSPAQLRYQSTDFAVLISFNMGTFAHNGDPCCDQSNWNVKAPYAAGKTRDPATFNPTKLNTTQWMESIQALGANIAVLTAKHGCGFALWPSHATLPDGSLYGYNVGMPGAKVQVDVLKSFVDAAKRAGIGYGFYYSIAKNFYLCRNFYGGNSCTKEVLPGQKNLTEEEYRHVARQQVIELWTKYGSLARIWVDSALDGMGDLMDELQPQAAGTLSNPVDWCGTESGHPSQDVGPQDVWSIGTGTHGDLNSSLWVPKFCDPQLFRQHVWFWEPRLQARMGVRNDLHLPRHRGARHDHGAGRGGGSHRANPPEPCGGLSPAWQLGPRMLRIALGDDCWLWDELHTAIECRAAL